MYSKKQLRTKILQIRDALTEEQRQIDSAKITEKVLASEEYKNAETILTYASFRSEVNTFPLIEYALKDGKKVYVPRIEEEIRDDGTKVKSMEFYRIVSKDELKRGYWGVPEPEAEVERLFSIGTNKTKDNILQEENGISLVKSSLLILLPGAVFDKNGNRIGYGGGFYDRYFAGLRLQKITTTVETDMMADTEISVCKMALAFDCQVVEQGMIPVEEHDVQVDVIVTEQGIYENILYGIGAPTEK